MKTNKVLLCLLIIASAGYVSADLKCDIKTDKFYSSNAPKGFNQNHYNDLVKEIMLKITPRGILHLSKYELAKIFTWLQLLKTKESLRLIEDIKQGLQEYEKQLKSLL